MTLRNAQTRKEYTIHDVGVDDDEMKAFLFSLGCYSGQPITVMLRRRGGCIVALKDARYHIDDQLAEAILVE